jgi:hypothetical protein
MWAHGMLDHPYIVLIPIVVTTHDLDKKVELQMIKSAALSKLTAQLNHDQPKTRTAIMKSVLPTIIASLQLRDILVVVAQACVEPTYDDSSGQIVIFLSVSEWDSMIKTS